MNFLTAAFGVLFMVGFLYGGAQALQEDSATKLARYKRMANDAAQSASVENEAKQAGAGVGVPGTPRRNRPR